jgi:hypothetical protein
MTGHALNEQAVQAAASLLDDSGLTHPQTGPPSAAVVTDLIAAYHDSLAEQGVAPAGEAVMRDALERMLAVVSAAAARIQLAFRDDEDLAPEILDDFDLLVTACRSARRALTEDER